MRFFIASLVLGLPAGVASAQGLSARITGARGDVVQFQVPARPGVCGDGRNYVRVDDDSWYGNMNDMTRNTACEGGVARVVVTRAGSDIIRLDTYVGPVQAPEGVTDLGRVSPNDAATWLAGLARSAEGRVARDAMLPLGVMDSASVTPTLLAMVRDSEQPRDTRRSALSWLVRRRNASDAQPATEVMALLTRIARDDAEHSALRQSALGQFARFERGEGVAPLIELTRVTTEGWLARQATEALGRLGDPRARRALRGIVADGQRPAELRQTAVQALASSYGSPRDAEALISAYPSFTTDPLRDAALSSIASIGGKASRDFIVRTVRDESAAARQRRRASSLLDRVGVSTREVIPLYDQVSDGEVRGHLIDMMAQAGTREATAKLIQIAKEDTQPNARRRAISALGKRDDPEVRNALKSLVGS